jgi:hypothetical protein
MKQAKQILYWFLWVVCITIPILLKTNEFIDVSWRIVLIPVFIYLLLFVAIFMIIALRYWRDHRALARAFEEYMDATDPADVLVAEEKWKKIDKLFGAEEPKE